MKAIKLERLNTITATSLRYIGLHQAIKAMTNEQPKSGITFHDDIA